MAQLEQIVLASTSPWRLRMLLEAGIEAEAVAPEVDESAYMADEPGELAALLARTKAEAVLVKRPSAVVIGADQVAHMDGEIFGKPANADDHLRRLQSLRGRCHELITAVAILFQEEAICFEVRTKIHFRSDLSDEELRRYVKSGEGRFCAGGYQIEGRGAWLIEKIEGDWFNVVGLPVLEVIGALRTRGWGLTHVASPASEG
jgi:septum formation protein